MWRRRKKEGRREKEGRRVKERKRAVSQHLIQLYLRLKVRQQTMATSVGLVAGSQFIDVHIYVYVYILVQ